MPFRPPKKPAQFSDLLGILTQSKTQDDPMYQTIEMILERLVQFHGSTLEQLAITTNRIDELIKQVNKDIDDLDDFVESIGTVQPNRLLGRGSLSGPGPQEELIPGVYITIDNRTVNVPGKATTVVRPVVDVTGAGETSFIVQNLDQARSRVPTPFLPGDYLPKAQETKLLASGYVTVATGTGVLGSTATIPAEDIEGSVVPSAHHVTHEPGGSDPLTVDAIPATGSLRTLGTGPNQAAAGNDTRFTDSRPPGPHQATHRPGGSDVLVNNAWLDTLNSFTENQHISKTNPELRLDHPPAGANLRVWDLVSDGLNFYIQPLTDAGVATIQAVRIDRNGNVIIGNALLAPAGLDATPLNASNLSIGTVPIARLPAHAGTHNVAGVDPIAIGTLAGYPANPAVFLNGAGGFTTPSTVPSAHQASHQVGGSDAIANVAWTNQANTFIAHNPIRLTSDDPSLRQSYNSAPANARAWRFVTVGDYHMQAQSDADVVQSTPIIMHRNGSVTVGNVLNAIGGLGTTPLDGSKVIGRIPVESLPTNTAITESEDFLPQLDGTGAGVGQTYSARLGKTSKTGELGGAGVVNLSFSVALTNLGGISGGISISGFPWNAKPGPNSICAIYFNNLAVPYVNIIGILVGGGNRIYLYGTNAAVTGLTQVQASACTNVVELQGTIVYETLG